MTELTYFLNNHHISAFFIIFFAITSAIFLIKSFVWHKLHLLAKKSETDLDDLLITRTKIPLRVFIILSSLQFALTYGPAWPQDNTFIQNTLKFLIGASLLWICERVSHTIVTHLTTDKKMGRGNSSLLSTLVRIVIISIGSVMILHNLGISITPILASLGVGSLAVALALQDTLSNFFNGLYLQFDQPVRIDDFVRLEDGSEGHIRKIGWRTTHIELLAGNTLIIPNSKLSSSSFINYDLPHKETLILIPVGVSYDSDLEVVEKITIEVGKQVLSSTLGGVATAPVQLRYNAFADSSINFNVVLTASHWTDQPLLRHNFIKLLHQRYKEQGIEIPYPQRVVHLQNH